MKHPVYAAPRNQPSRQFALSRSVSVGSTDVCNCQCLPRTYYRDDVAALWRSYGRGLKNRGNLRSTVCVWTDRTRISDGIIIITMNRWNVATFDGRCNARRTNNRRGNVDGSCRPRTTVFIHPGNRLCTFSGENGSKIPAIDDRSWT